MKRFSVLYFLFFLSVAPSLLAQTWNWTQSIGGTLSDKAITTKVTPTGDVVVSGSFSKPLASNIRLTSCGSRFCFKIKISSIIN